MASPVFPNVLSISSNTQRHGAVISKCHSGSALPILNLKHFRCFSELWIQEDGDFFNWWTFRLLTRLKHKGAATSYWSVSQQFSIWHLWNASKSKLPSNFSDISQELSLYQEYFYRGFRGAFVFLNSSSLIIHNSPKRLCQALVLSLIIIALTN